MASEPFSLLKQLKVGSYENCVILTYNADLFFFEQVVLPTLRSRGCYNNLVLMDLRQYEASLLSAASHLGSLGKSYSVLPVKASSAFHPKLILQSGQSGGRLILGSGNLTVRGFSSNWELFTEIHRGKAGESDGLFRQLWSFVRSVSENAVGAVDRQLRQFEETSLWLTETAQPPEWPRLLVARQTGPSIVDQLRQLVGEAKVRRLVVVSPFFDPNLRGVQELTDSFVPEQLWLVVQRDKVSLPGAVAATVERLCVADFEAPQKEKSAKAYLHAKAYILETDDGDFCLWGSPNCSSAAMVDTRNVELAILQKGKRRTFVNALGISDLLKKSNCFDPSSLTVRKDQSNSNDVTFRLIGAELCDDTIRVLLADATFMPLARVGRLSFLAAQEVIAEVDAKRETESVFSAKVVLRHDRGVVICRLVLKDGDTEVTSAPAAVHFASDIARATPSRHSSDFDRISRAIQSGSADWAKGLEQVYDLLFKIEQCGVHTGQQTRKGIARKVSDAAEEGPENPEEIKDFGYFIGSGQPAARKGRSAASLLLEDMLGALTSQMLRGVEKDTDDVDADDKDLWKYQEEAESGSAESGGTVTFQVPVDPDHALRAHRGLRNCYRRLMRQLTERFETIRDNDGSVEADEFWRLGAVNLLLMNGCGRKLSNWESGGAVLVPEDVLSDYLPAIGVALGRVCVLAHSSSSSSPLAMKAKCDFTDQHIRRSGATTSAILSGLVVARRRWLRQPSFIRGKDDPNGCPHFTEIIAARGLATLIRLGLLPTPEEFAGVMEETMPVSDWLTEFGTQVLQQSFRELSQRANVIVKAEDTYDAKHPPTPIGTIKEGAWVCAPSTGVTEVLKVSGKNVELARIGGNKKKEGAVKVMAQFVVPIGLSRSL